MKEKRENCKKDYLSFIFFVFLIMSLLLILPFVSSIDLAEGSQTSGFKLIINVLKKILDSSSTCRVLNNVNSDGNVYFVPTKTATEWNAFSAALGRLGITNVRTCTYCGDGVMQSPNDNNQNEQCDTNDLNGQTCSSVGAGSVGTLYCNSDCTFNTNNCDIPDPIEPTDPISEDPITCFPKGTLIQTPTGKKDITLLKERERVISYDTKNNNFVISTIQRLITHYKTDNWYYIIKTKDSEVNVTYSHPFYIGNGKYKTAEDLKVGDLIYVDVEGVLTKEKILSKERINSPIKITVYNLELNKDGPRNYFANNYLVHNGDHYFSITGDMYVKGA